MSEDNRELLAEIERLSAENDNRATVINKLTRERDDWHELYRQATSLVAAQDIMLRQATARQRSFKPEPAQAEAKCDTCKGTGWEIIEIGSRWCDSCAGTGTKGGVK
jgi:Zn finger protein HypA/HybF involved in hydrogenase expression